jgi:ABC-2 type transport system ATP-binding protein
MAMAAVIEVSNLTKNYGDTRAVDHISFEVGEGEVFGFLGPNGAGKTTTIRILTGLSRPTEGQAFVLGYDIASEIVTAKRHIGVVPELSNLYDELSAMDNLLFMAGLYGVPRRERKVRALELLRTFGLYERRDSQFRTLSRGMKRALTIAAALTHNPRLLFLDEPTLGLDVVAARSLRALIGNLHHQGVTVFLTTHYLEEADLLCDRIAIVVKGRIVKIGTPQALKAIAQSEPVTEVAFEKAISGMMESLSRNLPGIKTVMVSDSTARFYGGVTSDVLDTVLHIARDNNVKIDSVSSLKPSLEDAFIKITGLAPTVMAVEKGGGKQNVA